MTYAELYGAYYGPITRTEQDALFQSWDIPTRMAWRVITELSDRKGFTHWWHEIGDENRDEIFREIKGIVTREWDKRVEAYGINPAMPPSSAPERQPRLEVLSRLITALREEVKTLEAADTAFGLLAIGKANLNKLRAEISFLEEIEKEWRDKWRPVFEPKPSRPDFMTALAMLYSMSKTPFTITNELLESAQEYTLEIKERADGLGYELTVREK